MDRRNLIMSLRETLKKLPNFGYFPKELKPPPTPTHRSFSKGGRGASAPPGGRDEVYEEMLSEDINLGVPPNLLSDDDDVSISIPVFPTKPVVSGLMCA